MKTKQFVKVLKENGCILLRHGSRHDIWLNTKNGKVCSVPRHGSQEMPKGLACKILSELLESK